VGAVSLSGGRETESFLAAVTFACLIEGVTNLVAGDMALFRRDKDKDDGSDDGRRVSAKDEAAGKPTSSDDDAPDKPTELPVRSWGGVLKRTVREFRADNLTDWAAALTYYSILSIFPALIAFVSIVALVGQHPQTTDSILKIIDDIGPSSAVDTFKDPVETVIKNKSGAGFALVIGLAVALWSASSYVGAFMRASNQIYEVEEGRQFWKLRPLQIAITLVMILLLAIVAIAIVATGPLADAIGKEIGLGSAAVTAWDIAKWPVLLGFVILMFAVLYYAAPNVRHPGFRWITPGSAVAVIIWILASAGFAFYVSNFASYNKTYGSLAGVIIFLVWLWISNIAVLLGAELDAELERGRELEAGDRRAEEQIQLEPRTSAKT
jgi:membrane protein